MPRLWKSANFQWSEHKFAQEKRFCELIVKPTVGQLLATVQAKEFSPVRNFVPVSLLVLMLATNLCCTCRAQSSVIPNPVFLPYSERAGWLATLIRRHLND